MDRYQIGEVIGYGEFAIVYKGLDLKTKQTVAIKKMHSNGYSNGVPSTTIREISLLKGMEHENIVRLLNVKCDNGNEWYIIFEYMDIDLEKYMANSDSMDKKIIKNILHQILLGVAHSHKCKIMHRDLKPSNLLLDLNASVVKIADFGLARAFQTSLGEYTSEVVTRWYRPPEIYLGSPVYSALVDVWSVGCIFAEMIMHQRLFDGDTDADHLNQIFSIMGTPDEITWPGVTSLPKYRPDFSKHNPQNLAEIFPDLKPAGVDLLSKMLCMDPARRISARHALEHAYFNNNDDDEEEEQ